MKKSEITKSLCVECNNQEYIDTLSSIFVNLGYKVHIEKKHKNDNCKVLGYNIYLHITKINE